MMEDKTCSFKFKSVSGFKVELLLMNCKNKPPGVDYIKHKMLKPIVAIIAPIIAHIIT